MAPTSIIDSGFRSILTTSCLLLGLFSPGLAIAIPLQQLYNGATLTSGPIEFTNWNPAPGNNDPGAAGVEIVATNPSPDRWGFSVEDTTGGLQGADALNFNFTVDAGSLAVTEALLEITRYSVAEEGSLELVLSEQSGMMTVLLTATEPPPPSNLTVETTFGPPMPSPYDLRIDVSAISGPVIGSEIDAFGVEFSVPESGTAASLVAVLIGFGIVGGGRKTNPTQR